MTSEAPPGRPDKIHIRGLHVRTIIGFHAWEKDREQDVVIDLIIHHDQSRAAASDDVKDTVDYAGIRDDIVDYTADNDHGLLETLAERIAEIVLRHQKVEAVDVRVDKLAALRFADSVAVEIHRRRT